MLPIALLLQLILAQPGAEPSTVPDPTLPVLAPPAAASWQPQQDFGPWQQQQKQRYRTALLWPDEAPATGQLQQKEQRDGYQLEQWQLQLTSQTQSLALILRPARPIGAVLLLHDHGAFFALGKEKYIRPTDPAQLALAQPWVDKYFSGVFIGDELARQGYLVLAADSPGFASRGPLSYDQQQQLAANLLAAGHSLAGLAAYEDMQLASFLRQQLHSASLPLISLGFSMGAFRAWQVAALSDQVNAAVAACWFNSWPVLLKSGSNLAKGQSSFYFLHPGLNSQLDIADLVSLAAPKPLYLLNGGQDPLMPADAVLKGYHQLKQAWQQAGAAEKLRTELWTEAKHEFHLAQQQQVWAWLRELQATRPSR
ncbi:alpha/beta hydrolase family protein [Rheinheimera sp.]|uniref:dienelactone hydrolase family protein n=1 Tax=Rheinheimera sp. TaxID=1869214 RepID=UPI00307ECB08